MKHCFGARNACPSGKLAFTTRAAAKKQTALARVKGEHMRPYLCDDCGRWHVGHLPNQVLTGRLSADAYYDRTGS